MFGWFKRKPDAAWKPTGYTYRFTGHDEALGVKAVERAKIAAAQKLVSEANRAVAVRPASNVVKMRKKQ